MENDRKVVVCSVSDAFSAALRLLLDDFQTQSIGRLGDVSPYSDLLVYHTDNSLPLEQLAKTAEDVPTLVLAEPHLLIESVDAGCRGFLPHTAPLEQVREAIDTILEGGSVIPPDLLGTVLRHLVDRRRVVADDLDLHLLTDREREVFRLAAQGARKDEIGERLFISPDTARTHLQRVYRKLGINSQAELIALAAGEGVETDL